MLDSVPRLSYLIVIILIYSAAWFAVSETALSSASKTKLKLASEHGDIRADDALYVLDNFDKSITTILICTNIIHIAAASIVTIQVTRDFGVSWVSLSTIITTIIVFFFGEMLPKSLAKKNAEKYCLSNASLLIKFMKIFSPLSLLLTKIGNLASKLTKSEAEKSVTQSEIHDIIDDMEEDGTLDKDESELIQSAIDFNELEASFLYTRIKDVEIIDADSDINDVIRILKNSTHSRFPVFKGSENNIVGILNSKEFLKAYIYGNKNPSVTRLMQKPLFIDIKSKADDVLEQMTQHKATLAIVSNSSKKVLGVISIEDIVEALVGEIYDEDERRSK